MRPARAISVCHEFVVNFPSSKGVKNLILLIANTRLLYTTQNSTYSLNTFREQSTSKLLKLNFPFGEMKYSINCTSGASRQQKEDAKRGSIVSECSLDQPLFALLASSLSLSHSICRHSCARSHTVNQKVLQCRIEACLASEFHL